MEVSEELHLVKRWGVSAPSRLSREYLPLRGHTPAEWVLDTRSFDLGLKK